MIGKPNTLTTTLKGPGQISRFLVTDGKTVFTGGQKDEITTYIAGITPNKDDVDMIKRFPAGSTVTSQRLEYSGFDITTNSYLTGLSVQQSGDYLFASHSTLNQVRTINKNTGALLTVSNINGIRHLALQGENAMWLSKMSSHRGSTITQKLQGTVESSVYHKSDPPSGAFDGKAATAFKSIGGKINFLGIRFPKIAVITQVRMKAPNGVTQAVRVVGDDGWEGIQLGKITSTSVFETLSVTDATPFKGIRLEGLVDSGVQIDEVEVYGYDYSGYPVVARHVVNKNGSIGEETLSLSGITDPLSIALSPDYKFVAVADRGINHQVRIYNTSDGSLIRTIGRAENYSTPTVYDDKFYFNNTRNFNEHDYGQGHCFITFQSDGSLWIGDYGNMRCQHFSADGVYIDNIQTMGYSYSCQADVNDPTRVFSDYLEFAVNYNNNSWRFVRNWSKNVPFQVNIDAERVRSVATLSNGRTYGLYQEFGGNPRELIELDKLTGIRHTGLYLDTYNCDLFADGSVWQMSDGSLGKPCLYQRKALVGFNGINNPVWSNYQTVENIQNIVDGDPITAGGILRRSQQTSSGIIATFNSDNGQDARARGYHLGGIKNGQWIFKISPSTHIGYLGDYPKDGAYDIGNGVKGAGTFMQTIGKHIFWGYHGEFWKNGQTNKYNHYIDNGLMIGQFGVSSDQTQGYPAYPGMAGNAFSGTYVKVGDDIHFFHCDESHHAGVHHWKISNLNSINTQVFTIYKTGIPAPRTSSCVDLMADVPVEGSVNSSVGRWTYNASTYRRGTFDEWSVTAGTSVYKLGDRSLRFTSYPVKDKQTLEAYCDLSAIRGSINNSQSWQISGRVTYPEVIEPHDNFLEVVDKSGKIIIRISRPDSYPNSSVIANSTTIVTGILKQLYSQAQDISIQRIQDKLVVNFAGYPQVSVFPFDPAADLNSPTTLRVHFYSANNAGHQIDLANLKFCNTPVVTPVVPVKGTGTGLMGQYFNNRALTEPAAVQRLDSTVNFNWGLGSPFPGQLNVDSFSIRWSGQVQAPVSGTYVFSTLCDDGVRLWVNGVPLINNWASHATIDNSAAVTLVAGQKYDIRLEYYEGALGANMRLLWAYTGQSQQVIPTQQLYPAAIIPPVVPVKGTGTGLMGQYFNNRALTEPAAVQRLDSTVNFNWGLGSPFPGQLNVDSFSIRWSGQVQAPVSGTYVFSTLCDDGVRLWVNGVPLINNWASHATIDNSAAVTLVAGQKYDIRLEYYEGALGANMRLLWAYTGQSQQVIPTQQLYPAAIIPPVVPVKGTGTGLMGQYFNNRALTEPAAVQRLDSTVNFNWGLGSPFPGQLNVDSFSIRWSGQVQAPVSGTYVFSTLCDDGVRLWVNGVPLINNWASHATIDNSAAVTLVAGQKYDIRLEYYEGALGANMRLLWAYTGQSQQVIPTQQLYPAAIKSSSGRYISEETFTAQIGGTDKSALVNVYPVPARDFIWVSYQALNAGNTSIKLVEASGQIVRQTVCNVELGLNVVKMNVEALPQGLYLLQLNQGNTVITHRVILSN